MPGEKSIVLPSSFVTLSCQVCGEVSKGVTNYYVHLLSEGHGLTMTKKGTRFNCLICEVTLYNEGDMKIHLAGKKHRARSNQPLLEPKNIASLDDSTQPFSNSAQDKDLEDMSEDVCVYGFSEKPINDLFPDASFLCPVCNELFEEDHYAHLTSKKHGVTKCDDGRLLCDVCQVHSLSPINMIDHLMGKKHRAKTNQPLIEPKKSTLRYSNSAPNKGFQEISEDVCFDGLSVPDDAPFLTFHCHICDKVSEKVLDHYVHLISEEHGVTPCEDGRLFCDVCQVHSPSPQHMIDHLVGKKHRRKTDQPLIKPEGMALKNEEEFAESTSDGLTQCDYCLAQSNDWKLMIMHMTVQHSQVIPEDHVEPSLVRTNFVLHIGKRKQNVERVVQVKCNTCDEVCPTKVDQMEHMKSHLADSNSALIEGLQDVAEEACVDTSEKPGYEVLSPIDFVDNEAVSAISSSMMSGLELASSSGSHERTCKQRRKNARERTCGSRRVEESSVESNNDAGTPSEMEAVSTLIQASQSGFTDFYENQAGGHFAPWFLGHLKDISSELKNFLYNDEVDSAAKSIRPLGDYSNDEQGTCDSDEELDLVSQCIKDQIEHDEELSGSYCWFCGGILAESESVETHTQRKKHQYSVRMRSALKYCGICHDVYFYSAKEHAKSAWHEKANARKNPKQSLQILTSTVIQVTCATLLQSFYEGLEAAADNVVCFEFWWPSPRQRSCGKDSLDFGFPPFCMAFKSVSTEKVYALDLNKYTSYSGLPLVLLQFLLSDSYAFVGSLRNVVRMRAGLSQQICPRFIDICNLCKSVIKMEDPISSGKRVNSSLVRAALYVEPAIRLPPKAMLSLGWDDLIKSEFGFRMDIMTFLWDRMIQTISSWSVNSPDYETPLDEDFDHNGNLVGSTQDDGSVVLQGLTNDHTTVECNFSSAEVRADIWQVVQSGTKSTECLTDCVEQNSGVSGKKDAQIHSRHAEEESTNSVGRVPDYAEATVAYSFLCLHCNSLFRAPADLYDHFHSYHGAPSKLESQYES